MDNSSHIKSMAKKLFLEGHDLIAVGAYGSAETTLQKCLRTYVKIYGPDHFAVATAHELLGHVYAALEKKEQAYIHYNAAVRISKSINQRDNSAKDLGGKDLFQENNTSHHGEANLNASSSRRSMTSDGNNTTITEATSYRSCDSKSSLKLAMGRMNSGLRLEQEKEAKACFREGKILMKEGKYEDAIDPLRRSMRSFIMIHGEDHLDVAAVHELLGTAFSKVDDPETAQFHFDAVLWIMEVNNSSFCDHGSPGDKSKRRRRKGIRSASTSKSNVRAVAA